MVQNFPLPYNGMHWIKYKIEQEFDQKFDQVFNWDRQGSAILL